MGTRVVFNEGRHTYALDGRYTPGVTTVINKASASGGLIYWAAKQAAQWAATNVDLVQALGEEEWIKAAAGAADRARDAAGDAGRQVHQLAEALVYGEPLPPETPEGLPWPDDVFRTAEQLARFYDAWDVRPVVHEAIVFHETHWWAGRLDLIADLSDGNRWLLDYKTGSSGIWPSTALQLAAYRHATHIQVDGNDQPMEPLRPARCGAVWLRPDGWQLHPVRADADVYRVFGYCLRVAEFHSLKKEQSVLAPLPVPDQKEAS